MAEDPGVIVGDDERITTRLSDFDMSGVSATGHANQCGKEDPCNQRGSEKFV